jgi:hypothetical protein
MIPELNEIERLKGRDVINHVEIAKKLNECIDMCNTIIKTMKEANR